MARDPDPKNDNPFDHSEQLGNRFNDAGMSAFGLRLEGETWILRIEQTVRISITGSTSVRRVYEMPISFGEAIAFSAAFNAAFDHFAATSERKWQKTFDQILDLSTSASKKTASQSASHLEASGGTKTAKTSTSATSGVVQKRSKTRSR